MPKGWTEQDYARDRETTKQAPSASDKLRLRWVRRYKRAQALGLNEQACKVYASTC